MNYIQCLADLSQLVVNSIIVFSFIALGFLLSKKYKEVTLIQEKIEKIEDEIDKIPKQVHQRCDRSSQPIANRTREKIIQKEIEPKRREIEHLQRHKQNILDKIPFLGFFTK